MPLNGPEGSSGPLAGPPPAASGPMGAPRSPDEWDAGRPLSAPPRSPESDPRAVLSCSAGAAPNCRRCSCSNMALRCSTRSHRAIGFGCPLSPANSERRSNRGGGDDGRGGRGPPVGGGLRWPPASGRWLACCGPGDSGVRAGFCGAVTVPPAPQHDRSGERSALPNSPFPHLPLANVPAQRAHANGRNPTSRRSPLRPCDPRFVRSTRTAASVTRSQRCFCYRTGTVAVVPHPHRCFRRSNPGVTRFLVKRSHHGEHWYSSGSTGRSKVHDSDTHGA